MTFDDALALAKQEQRAGSILRHHVQTCPARGRVIWVECDQGWNPEPFFQEEPTWF